jgi:hypothetical protein
MAIEDVGSKPTAQELYGEGTIVSTPQDPLAGKSVSIQSTGGTKFDVKLGEEMTPEGTPAGTPEGTQVTPEVKTEDAPTEETPLSVEEQVQKQVEAGKALEADLTSKGVDFKALEKEYMETGLVSPASREVLAKAGYPSQVVDAYISGMSATAERFENEVYSIAGGKENFTQIQSFIKSQGQAHIDAFNQAIEAGNMTQIGMLFEGVKSRIVTARGTQKATVLGTKSNTVGTVDAFKTRSEMVSAMSDRRYNKDRAYTEAVHAKTLRSNF